MIFRNKLGKLEEFKKLDNISDLLYIENLINLINYEIKLNEEDQEFKKVEIKIEDNNGNLIDKFLKKYCIDDIKS